MTASGVIYGFCHMWAFRTSEITFFTLFCWNLSLLDFTAALITCSTTLDFTNVSHQHEKGRENMNCCELMSRVTHVSQAVMKQPVFFKLQQKAPKSGFFIFMFFFFFHKTQAAAKNWNNTARLETWKICKAESILVNGEMMCESVLDVQIKKIDSQLQYGL